MCETLSIDPRYVISHRMLLSFVYHDTSKARYSRVRDLADPDCMGSLGLSGIEV